MIQLAVTATTKNKVEVKTSSDLLNACIIQEMTPMEARAFASQIIRSCEVAERRIRQATAKAD